MIPKSGNRFSERSCSSDCASVRASTPVLVVDDSLTVRNIVVKRLNSLGFADVDVAEDGNSALERIREKQYGLLISDWEMPNMSGEEFFKTVRQDPKCMKMPIIMITGTTTARARHGSPAPTPICKSPSPTPISRRPSNPPWAVTSRPSAAIEQPPSAHSSISARRLLAQGRDVIRRHRGFRAAETRRDIVGDGGDLGIGIRCCRRPASKRRHPAGRAACRRSRSAPHSSPPDR